MNTLRRSAPRALQQAERTCLRRSQRRLASESHAEPPAETHATPHHEGPVNEGFGKSFYILLAAVPASILVFNFSRDDSGNNPITRLINAYTTKQETWMEMNALHTRMIEQAGHDRNLFLNTHSPSFVELKFPEALNGGSPFNVRAGWGNINMDHVVAQFRDKAFKEEEEKLQKMNEGKLPGQPNYVDPSYLKPER